jgi:hypothetical protein
MNVAHLFLQKIKNPPVDADGFFKTGKPMLTNTSLFLPPVLSW